MKRFAMAAALACALSGTALAGLIPSTGITAPAPEPPTATAPGHVPSTDSTSPGDIHSIYVTTWLTVLDLVF